jgi:hypothetical protein
MNGRNFVNEAERKNVLSGKQEMSDYMGGYDIISM